MTSQMPPELKAATIILVSLVAMVTIVMVVAILNGGVS